MEEKKVTIREVAELAGVSISSVSRYLADLQKVSSRLQRASIKNAINELQYEPNMFARNLKKRTDTDRRSYCSAYGIFFRKKYVMW